jgi:hypothetical protein
LRLGRKISRNSSARKTNGAGEADFAARQTDQYRRACAGTLAIRENCGKIDEVA